MRLSIKLFLTFEVTDHEINRGILKSFNVDDRTLVFIRNIEDIESFVSDQEDILGRFIDLDSNKLVDQLSKDRLNQLKSEKLQNAYSATTVNENIATYSVSFLTMQK